MRKRGILAVGQCPSVRLSVTLMHCIQVVKDIVKLLFWPGSPIIGHPVLPNLFPFRPSGGVKYTRWDKFACVFD